MASRAGGKLGPVTLAYETYGNLDADKGNAILILHALPVIPMRPVIMRRPIPSPAGGTSWWPRQRHRHRQVFCDLLQYSGKLHGIHRTRAPSIPRTDQPYGLEFPGRHHRRYGQGPKSADGSFRDRKATVVVGRLYRRHAGAGVVRAISAKWWYPPFRWPPPPGIPPWPSPLMRWPVRPSWPIPTGTTAIIMPGDKPDTGLAVARMIGHITYLSDESMRHKFGRRLQDKSDFSFQF